MTTSLVEVLEELAKKWRFESDRRSDLAVDMENVAPDDAGWNNGIAAGMDECADELEAAIALMRAPVGDRAALEYLMVQFDAEFHACERCGHEEPTKDCDSAIYLRRYLGETK